MQTRNKKDSQPPLVSFAKSFSLFNKAYPDPDFVLLKPLFYFTEEGGGKFVSIIQSYLQL